MNPAEPPGTVVLRVPRLPVSALRTVLAVADAEAHDGQGDAAYATRALLGSGAVEALAFAAPGLYTTPHGSPARSEKRSQAVHRYLSRMCTRPTPYGLFAGLAMGSTGEKCTLEIGDRVRINAQVDAEWLNRVLDLDHVAPHANGGSFFLNPTAWRRGEHWRFVRRFSDDRKYAFELLTLEATPLLAAVARFARVPRRYEEFVAFVMGASVPRPDAGYFLAELLRAGFLVGAFDLCSSAGLQLVDRALALAASPSGGMCEQDRSTLRALAKLDGKEVWPIREPHVLEAFDLDPNITRSAKLDMQFPGAQIEISKHVLVAVASAIRVLHQTSADRRDDDLIEFRRRFVDRYGGAEIPLLEALDADIGVGFSDEPTGSAVRVPAARTDRSTAGSKWTGRDEVLLTILSQALNEGADGITLDDSTIGALSSHPRELPPTFCTMVTVLAESAAAIDHGNYRLLLKAVAGPSAACLLGRFCAQDESLTRTVRAMIAYEDAQVDALHAEVFHAPAPRAINVVNRPLLRRHEIPVFAAAGENAIELRDLLVSVEDDQVVLRTRQDGKRVEPHFSTALNYSRVGIKYARFLWEIARSRYHDFLTWNWGALSGAARLPAIIVGRTILSPRMWNVPGAAIAELRSARPSAALELATNLQSKYRMPEYCGLVEGDNVLYCDFRSTTSMRSLPASVGRRRLVRFVELFLENDQLCVTSGPHRFTHELMLPMIRGQVVPPEGSGSSSAGNRAVAPTRARRGGVSANVPADGWCYVRIYSGEALLDDVLGKWAEELRRLKLRTRIDSWFFIRYGDPHWHLRLRLRAPAAQVERVISPTLWKFFLRLQKSGLAWRFEQAVYEQEVRRYGGRQGLALAETVFHVDSETFLRALPWISGNRGRDLRTWFGVLAFKDVIDQCWSDVPQRHRFVDGIRGALLGKLAGPEGSPAARDAHRALGRDSRTWLSTLQRLDASGRRSDVVGSAVANALEWRGQQMRAILRRLEEVRVRGWLAASHEEYVASLLHMCLNKIAESDHAAHELRTYDLLWRFYPFGKRATSAGISVDDDTAVPGGAAVIGGGAGPEIASGHSVA